MIILYIILGIVVLILLIALFLPKEIRYEKSIRINAPRERVWENTGTLTAMDAWSPWNARDPGMEKTITGTDGQPGARQSWKSQVKNVGEGSQTIVNVNAANRMDTRLDFVKPFKSKADAYVLLSGEGKDTQVTWGFKSRMPYPTNLMILFINFEKAMDKDFGEGLGKLKSLCEKDG